MAATSTGPEIAVEVEDEQPHTQIMPATIMADVKVVQKNALKMANLCVTISAIWIFGNIHGSLTTACSEPKSSHGRCQHLIANAYALVSFMSFEIEILLLLFSILLPQVPRIIGLAKKLVWAAFVLVHMALVLKMTTHVAC